MKRTKQTLVPKVKDTGTGLLPGDWPDAMADGQENRIEKHEGKAFENGESDA